MRSIRLHGVGNLQLQDEPVPVIVLESVQNNGLK